MDKDNNTFQDDMEAPEERLSYQTLRTHPPPSELESIGRHFNSSPRQVHVTALDEVVSVNGFFTVAVFIGITMTNTSGMYVGSGDRKCIPGTESFKRLIVYEVVAFSWFQFSSLIAHGLKLLMLFVSSKKVSTDGCAEVDHRLFKLLRLGILASAVGSAAGTIFLMLSLVSFIQMRFGYIVCGDQWTVLSAAPLISLVSTGVAIFVASVFYAFLH